MPVPPAERWTLSNHPSRLPLEQFEKQCRFKFTRASGPGGQHRNKVETAVVARHEPTGIDAAATEARSQHANRRTAIFRLRIRIAVELEAELSEQDSPSELWRSRCRGGKIACNPEHDDFPAMLAEVMGQLQHYGYDVKAAASALQCSQSQFLKFLANSPSARERVQQERDRRGMIRLRF